MHECDGKKDSSRRRRIPFGQRRDEVAVIRRAETSSKVGWFYVYQAASFHFVLDYLFYQLV